MLLIADEVITGFGRTGRWFALGHWDVEPDLVSFAKGVTSGYLPLGGVIAVEAGARRDPERAGSTANSCTRRPIRGHPVCCAVGLRNVEIIESEGLVERAAVMGRRLLAGLEGAARPAGCRRCARARHDVRRRAGDRQGDQGAGARARRQVRRARRWRAGCCRASAPAAPTRRSATRSACAPPLSTPAEMLDRIPQILREAIAAATA